MELKFGNADLEKLKATVSVYDAESIENSLERIIDLYKELRKGLYPDSIDLNERLRKKTEEFLIETKNKIKKKPKTVS